MPPDRIRIVGLARLCDAEALFDLVGEIGFDHFRRLSSRPILYRNRLVEQQVEVGVRGECEQPMIDIVAGEPRAYPYGEYSYHHHRPRRPAREEPDERHD